MDTKDHGYESIYMKCPQQASSQGQKVGRWAQGLQGSGWGVTPRGYGVPFWGDGNLLELGSSEGYTTL